MPRKSVEERIVVDFNRTGFPLEIEAATEMKQKYAWQITHQAYYEGSQSEARSIDLVATKRATGTAQVPGTVTIKIIAECKQKGKNPTKAKVSKVQKPWVFYLPNTGIPGGNTEAAAKLGITHAHVMANKDILLAVLAQSHLFRNNPHFSAIALEAFSKGQNVTTYEGISQISMATKYFQSEVQAQMSAAKDEKKTGDLLTIIYPMLIVDLPLYELSYDVSKHGFVVKASDHIIHVYEFKGKTLFIEIVKKEFFPNLMERIEREVGMFGTMITGGS